MNRDQWQGKWKELKGIIKEKWGQLTEDDLTQLEGNRDRLAGLVQQKYGLAKEEVERQIREFEKHIGSGPA
jgi:uncharacterized protein YjbJ (UPF0337 family)